MLKSSVKRICLIIVGFFLSSAQAFVPRSRQVHSSGSKYTSIIVRLDPMVGHTLPRPLTLTSSSLISSTTALADANKSVDGTGRGNVILALVGLIAIWIFSIPPEFRRAHICTTDGCVANRSSCYDCVTISEWKQGVKEYYDNGGGISFDFTVAQETKDLWAGKK